MNRIIDNLEGIFKDPLALYIFCVCLREANHEGYEGYFNGQDVQIKSGEFLTTRNSFHAMIDDIDKSTLWRKLRTIEAAGYIELTPDDRATLLRVKDFSGWEIATLKNHHVIKHHNRLTVDNYTTRVDRYFNNLDDELPKFMRVWNGTEDELKILLEKARWWLKDNVEISGKRRRNLRKWIFDPWIKNSNPEPIITYRDVYDE